MKIVNNMTDMKATDWGFAKQDLLSSEVHSLPVDRHVLDACISHSEFADVVLEDSCLDLVSISRFPIFKPEKETSILNEDLNNGTFIYTFHMLTRTFLPISCRGNDKDGYL